MAATIIDGKQIAAEVRADVARDVAALKASHRVTPGLAAVLVGDDPASAVYVRNKAKACEEVGMFSEVITLPATTPQAKLAAVVRRLNADPRFHGILVQLPLPRQIDERAIILTIDPDKDVDGLHPVNAGRLLGGLRTFVPATPLGVQTLLVRTNNDPSGKHVVILGRSNLVGKPLAALLVQKAPGANATVTVCHTGTRDVAAITRQADILVAAMGVPGYVKADMVRPGAVVIDVGTTRVDDPAKKSGYRIAGDVDFEPVAAKAGAISPVPGGVGPMTIAMLLTNTLLAAKRAVEAAPR
ncbi:MAG: bifunctional methylenetetrahydrofolate dehydrogenase/methenyltetrahydrofolate cyclohydrolase FolD [SAR202 cluster bacterium]|nr:bifunctional methylenetetrahydrofolate dehydrogenase/methenyltetrahydrofolate cyclohydrolase FolD [SAR202 cluster bacterium]